MSAASPHPIPLRLQRPNTSNPDATEPPTPCIRHRGYILCSPYKYSSTRRVAQVKDEPSLEECYFSLLPPQVFKIPKRSRWGMARERIGAVDQAAAPEWPKWLGIQPVPDPRVPTPAPPGTVEKLWVMWLRDYHGLPVINLDDARWFDDDPATRDDYEHFEDCDVSLNTLLNYLRAKHGGAYSLEALNGVAGRAVHSLKHSRTIRFAGGGGGDKGGEYS